MAMEERMTAAWLTRRSETALFEAEQVPVERVPVEYPWGAPITNTVPVEYHTVPVAYP